MAKHIEGTINEHGFFSEEPIAIGFKVSELVPNSNENGLSAKVMKWAWKHLTEEDSADEEFDEAGVHMKVVL